MIVQVYITCYGCIDHNKHRYDDVDFKEFRETKFESFSEAFNHKLEYPDHYMTFETYVNDGDEE